MGLREFVARSRVLVEDVFLTSPRLAFRPQIGESLREPVTPLVHGLEEKGYATIGSVLSPGDLKEIREAIDAALEKQRAGIDVEWSEKVQYARVLNPLRLHPKLLELAAH